MRKKTLYLLLSLEGVLCAALCLLRPSVTGLFTTVMAFPTEPLGLALRTLSLTGRPGAAAALALYAALCLVPVWYLLRERARRPLRGEDALLGLLTVWLAFALYLMANPAKLSALSPVPDLEYGKLLVGGAGWALLASWLVFRVLRRAYGGGMGELRRELGVFLTLLCVLFVWGACHGAFGALVTSFGASVSMADRVSVVLQFVMDALPWAADLVVTLAALDLLAAMGKDTCSEETAARADALSKRCGVCLAVVAAANLAFYAFELLMVRALSSVTANVSFPVFSVCFVLAALLLARVVEENRRLKADSDSII